MNRNEYRKYIEKLYYKLGEESNRKRMQEYESFIYTSFMRHGDLDLRELEAHFGVSLNTIHPGLLQVLEHLGFVIVSNHMVYLTEQGQQLAGNVISNFSLTEIDAKYFT